jgi:hypothetical protein
MEPEIMIVLIVAIACATGLIKSWINRNNDRSGIDEEHFDRLARAFMQHKKEMTERVQNLESIIADDGDHSEADYSKIEASSSGTTLVNDLQQKNKNKVQS